MVVVVVVVVVVAVFAIVILIHSESKNPRSLFVITLANIMLN